MKNMIKLLLMLFCVSIIGGCLSVNVDVSQTYEPTVDIQKFNKVQEIPYQYTVFGSCTVEGNYQDYSIDDLYRKILKEGEKVGADAVLIKSIRVVPHGRAVAFNPTLNIIGATEGANAQSWEDINKDFDGGYGSIRNKNIGTTPNYDRIVTGEFIKYDLDNNGELIVAKRDTKTQTEDVK
jgi:hypothetical protein